MIDRTIRGASSLLARSGECAVLVTTALTGVSKILSAAVSVLSNIGVPLLDASGTKHIVPVNLDDEFIVYDTNNVAHAIQTDGIVWTVIDASGANHDIPLEAV